MAYLENFRLSRYSQMLSESILEKQSLQFNILNDADDKKGTLSKEMLREFENSQLEQIIDSRYESASMTDLAVTEFQRALSLNFTSIMAMYAKALSQILQQQYPFISQMQMKQFIIEKGLINEKLNEKRKEFILEKIISESCMKWKLRQERLKASHSQDEEQGDLLIY